MGSLRRSCWEHFGVTLDRFWSHPGQNIERCFLVFFPFFVCLESPRRESRSEAKFMNFGADYPISKRNDLTKKTKPVTYHETHQSRRRERGAEGADQESTACARSAHAKCARWRAGMPAHAKLTRVGMRQTYTGQLLLVKWTISEAVRPTRRVA